MRRPSLVALLLAPFLLAGCAGAGAGGVESTASPPCAECLAPDAEGGGEIRGRVIDESVQPIAGAQIALAGTQIMTTSGADGGYDLRGVPAGPYTLQAVALGFGSFARAVTVVAGESVDVTVTLTAIAVSAPYQETFGPFQGYFECRLGIGTQTGECGWVSGVNDHPTQLYPNDRSIFRFNISSEDYRTFIGDIRWTQGAFATSTAMRMAFSYDKRDSSHWWCSTEGPSPAQWRYETDGTGKCANKGSTAQPDKPYLKNNPMRSYANMPFPSYPSNPLYVSYQQKFEVLVSAFYGEKAPEGYVGFPDA